MNMPVTHPAFAAKLEAITDCYEAWFENGNAIEEAAAARSLDEAIDIATSRCCHKGGFVIVETKGLSGQKTMRCYRVKKSTKRFTYRPALDGHYQVREGKLEATCLFSTPVHAFEPKAPWRWSPDDPTGLIHSGDRRADTVEQRS